jgi:hypothetical protein
MPLRASKMKGFILGFQRRVWCPKWTPDSNNSLTPILTQFSFGWESLQADHPAEHGIDFDVIRPAFAALCAARTHTDTEEAVFLIRSAFYPAIEDGQDSNDASALAILVLGSSAVIWNYFLGKFLSTQKRRSLPS